MSEEYYKVIDDIFNPVRKEYKHEFYCKECANIGFFKKQTTSRLWASCPNCHDGGMNYIDSSSETMWQDDHAKIVEYLKFKNLIYSAKKQIEICMGCDLNLMNQKYNELYGEDVNDFIEFRECWNNEPPKWYEEKCTTPSSQDIYKFPAYDIEKIRRQNKVKDGK